jgi:predicted small metal-binding protein
MDFMKRLILRCRDAGMMGPFCDYITDADTFDEAVRELRVHTKVHHEREITDNEVIALKKRFFEKSEVSSVH